MASLCAIYAKCLPCGEDKAQQLVRDTDSGYDDGDCGTVLVTRRIAIWVKCTVANPVAVIEAQSQPSVFELVECVR